MSSRFRQAPAIFPKGDFPFSPFRENVFSRRGEGRGDFFVVMGRRCGGNRRRLADFRELSARNVIGRGTYGSGAFYLPGEAFKKMVQMGHTGHHCSRCGVGQDSCFAQLRRSFPAQNSRLRTNLRDESRNGTLEARKFANGEKQGFEIAGDFLCGRILGGGRFFVH